MSDAGGVEPVGEPQLHLPGTDPTSVEGAEQCAGSIGALRQMILQQSSQPTIQEYELLDVPLPIYSNSTGSEIHVADVQVDE